MIFDAPIAEGEDGNPSRVETRWQPPIEELRHVPARAGVNLSPNLEVQGEPRNMLNTRNCPEARTLANWSSSSLDAVFACFVYLAVKLLDSP